MTAGPEHGTQLLSRGMKANGSWSKGGRNSDQDQEGDLADTARGAELPPRIAYDGMLELSPSYRQIAQPIGA